MKKSRKKKRTIVILVALLIIAVLCAALWCSQVIGKSSLEGSDADPTAAPTAEPTMEPVEIVETEDGLQIDMKYITLNYLIEYADDAIINIDNKDAGSEMTVLSNIGGENVEIYTLALTKEEFDGFNLGVLNSETDGEIGVYLRMNEQNAADWSEDEYARISVLQESANLLLMQIYESADYVSTR